LPSPCDPPGKPQITIATSTSSSVPTGRLCWSTLGCYDFQEVRTLGSVSECIDCQNAALPGTVVATITNGAACANVTMATFGRYCFVVASVSAIKKYIGGVLTTRYLRTYSNIVCIDMAGLDPECNNSRLNPVTQFNTVGWWTTSTISHTIRWSYLFQNNIKIYKSTSGTANGPWSLVKNVNVVESSTQLKIQEYTETVSLPTTFGQTLSYYYKAVATNKCGTQQTAIAYQTYTNRAPLPSREEINCSQCTNGTLQKSYYWTGLGGNQWLKHVGGCTWVGTGNVDYSQVALRWYGTYWAVTVLSKAWGMDRAEPGPSTVCSPKGTYLNLGRIS